MSNLWFTKDSNGFLAWFRLEDSKGELRTGGIVSDFAVTVVNPGDTTSNSPTVSESSVKPGLYNFLIPSAFLIANGVGEYGVVVEVDTNLGSGSPKVVGTFAAGLKVNTKDFEDLVGADVNATAEAIWNYTPTTVTADSFGEKLFELYESKILAKSTTQTGTTTTEIKIDLTEASNYYDGYSVYIIDDTNPTTGIDTAIRKIDSFTSIGTDGFSTIYVVEPLPFIPPDGSRVLIIGNHSDRFGRI